MTKLKGGFTLIELLIVVAFVGIVVACFGHAFSGPSTKCIAGFTYIEQVDGQYHQMIGTNGGGVPCH